MEHTTNCYADYYDFNPLNRIQSSGTTLTWGASTMKVYNPETHDLVEKPEAKIARLKGELKEMETAIDYLENRVNITVEAVANRKEKKDKLKKQLKKLEK